MLYVKLFLLCVVFMVLIAVLAVIPSVVFDVLAGAAIIAALLALFAVVGYAVERAATFSDAVASGTAVSFVAAFCVAALWLVGKVVLSSLQ